MKVKVTVEAQIDTERISKDKPDVVKTSIERAAFNKSKDNLAEQWALQEVENQHSLKWIKLELL